MLGPIVYLGCSFRPSVFLLVVNPVFSTGLHPGLLQSKDGLVGCFTGKEGIGTKAFPVSTGFREIRVSTPCVVPYS